MDQPTKVDGIKAAIEELRTFAMKLDEQVYKATSQNDTEKQDTNNTANKYDQEQNPQTKD